jgi:predicted nucleic acid-binding protein
VRYLDSSVVLSEIMAEGRRPPLDFWSGPLISSRLLTIEVWTRMQAYGVRETHADIANRVLGAIKVLEMDLPVLERAHEPFPNPIRALDAIHLSSASYLRDQAEKVEIATYDTRMRATAQAMGFELYPLE